MRFFCLCLLMFCTSCTAILDLDPRERFIVVQGALINEPKQTILVNYSAYLDEVEMMEINHANVVVEELNLDGEVVAEYEFESCGSGQYEAYFEPKFGLRYNLSVEVPGYATVSASTVYPIRENIRNLTKGYDRYWFESKNVPLYLWVYGVEMDYRKDSFVPVQYIYANPKLTVADYSGFDLEVEFIQHVDVDSFNVLAMIDDVGEPIHWRYVRCELGTESRPHVEGGRWWYGINVIPDFALRENGVPDSYSYVSFDSVSAEYDRYLKEVISYDLKLDHLPISDFASLYERHEIYTNVQNGTGIFGAIYRQRMSPLVYCYYEEYNQ